MAKRNIWTDERERVLLASLLTAMNQKQTQEQWFEALHTPDKDGKKPGLKPHLLTGQVYLSGQGLKEDR